VRTVPYGQEDAKIPEDGFGEGGPIGNLRAAAVTEAKTWIRTPFHHAARVKSAGVDCLMLLAEVYERAGITTGRINPPFYVPDWHLHRDAERYMEGLLRYARPVTAPEPGDIALFRFGRTYSHGAIVTE
jgi:cell wall-associated NlpC family hydrolase